MGVYWIHPVCLSVRLSVCCCMNFAIIIQWIYFSIWKKEKKNCHHYNTILSLYISYQDITRRVWSEIKYTMDMKNYLWTQITLYEEDKKEEASMRYSLLHGSWDQILQRCPSVCPLTFRVRPVASTVQDGFFPYLVQMINSMRGCVACDDPWPWHISSRSFGLDLKNRVRSVASRVLDGFFLYLAQMITIIRGCVACYVLIRIWKFEFLANFWKFLALTLKKKLQFSMDFFHISHK